MISLLHWCLIDRPYTLKFTCFRGTIVFGLHHYSMEREIYHPWEALKSLCFCFLTSHCVRLVAPLQRYSNFLSHHSSHQLQLQLQLQPAQQYFSLTPFHHSSSSLQLQPAERGDPTLSASPAIASQLQLLPPAPAPVLIASQLSPLILPCLHHLQLRYSHLMPTERFIDLIRPHTVAKVSHHRR